MPCVNRYTVFVMASGETIASGLTLDQARKRCRQWNKSARTDEWATWKQEPAAANPNSNGGAA